MADSTCRKEIPKDSRSCPIALPPRPSVSSGESKSPGGTPEPKPKHFTAATYEKNYQDPRDDWGVTGGILRCNDDGTGLEIISRGFRNPWDIAFDDQFNWLGTDNDQTMGDKLFTPFYGAHFGWGHTWSYDWKGDDHLPTAPSSGPLFEGSGAGIIFCEIPAYPDKYKNIFLYSDWLNREVRIFRTKWDGAWRKADRDNLEILAHAGGGRSMPLSEGRAFDPVDIEMGPDGAIWISSWGRQYGAHYEGEKLANEGRIYRIWPKGCHSAPVNGNPFQSDAALIAALGHHLPVWRTNAQEQLLQRGEEILPALLQQLASDELTTAQETWLVWTARRIDPARTWMDRNTNQKIQSLRVQGFLKSDHGKLLPSLKAPEPRVRLAAVLAIRESGLVKYADDLINLAARETDRIVYYATWGALMDLLPTERHKTLLGEGPDSVRLAALLCLLEQDTLSHAELELMTKDPFVPIADLAAKRLGGKHEFEHRGRALTATGKAPEEKKAIVIPFANVSASSNRSYRPAVLAEGSRLYTDRDYRITKVPAELKGLTFLQTACSDADATGGISVQLDLKYPATVYLIDDSRAENLPTWAKGKWKPTLYSLEAVDPKEMKVYEAEFPAGPLTLGTSRDGIQARKGNYIIAFRPRLISPNGSVATEETILPLLETADIERGHDLFFSPTGANCASCHLIDEVGNNHAPDLSNIGSRADAKALIDSILNPSANIVEGFAAHAVATTSGEAYSGIILNETGRSLTMALMGGATVEIPRKDIASREGLPISAMPAGFGAMMTSQQLADLTAYLQTLKRPEPNQVADGVFKFQLDGGELQLYLGQTQVATYLLKHDQLTRRAFVNVRTPSGILVTRNFPPRKPEDIDPGYKAEAGIIHPVMHPGLWMSFGWIDGNDYWRLTSKVVHDGFHEVPIGKRGEASFQSRDRYLSADGSETICLQDTRYHFRHIEEGILLDWDAEFYNDERDFIFGDQEESGLALRIASPLRVQGGNGEIVNNRGEKNGAGTWGKKFEWINYSGEVDGKRVGLLVIPHPENPGPSWSHSRDYGVLVSNPFPKQPRERREPYVKTTVKKGERFRLRYTVLIHEGDAQGFDPAALAKRIRKAVENYQ